MKLVLLPGLDGTGEHFTPFLAELPESWDALMIRYPNEVAQDYASLTEYVAQQLTQEEPIYLLAESFSGPIAYRLATEYAFPIKAVIFVATFLTSPQPRLLWLRHFAPSHLPFKLRAPNWLMRRYLLDEQTSDTFLAHFWRVVDQVEMAVILQRFAAIARLPRPEKKLTYPCLYLQASHDILVPKRSVEDFKQVCPHLEVIQIPGRHFLLQAKPEPCVEAIGQWSNGLDKI